MADDKTVITLRLTADLGLWLRKLSAEETIKHNKRVSMNHIITKILMRAKEIHQEKGLSISFVD